MGPTHPHRMGPDNITSTNIVRNTFLKSSPVILEEVHDHSSLKARPCRGVAGTKLGNLNAVGMIGSGGGRGQMKALNHKGKVSVVTTMDNGTRAAFREV